MPASRRTGRNDPYVCADLPTLDRGVLLLVLGLCSPLWLGHRPAAEAP